MDGDDIDYKKAFEKACEILEVFDRMLRDGGNSKPKAAMEYENSIIKLITEKD